MARSSAYAIDIGGTGSTNHVPLTSIPWTGSGQTSFTFSCWVNPGAATSDNEGIFGNWGSVSTGNMMIRARFDAGVFEMFTRDNSPTTRGPDIHATSLSDDTWHQVGMYANGTTVYMIIDGALSTGLAVGTGFDAASNTIPEFGYLNSSQIGFSGWIRDAAWWNRALGAGARASLANGANPLMFAPDNYWPMDNTLKDLIGQNDLTLGSGSSHSTSATGNYSWLPYPSRALHFDPAPAAAPGGGLPPFLPLLGVG